MKFKLRKEEKKIEKYLDFLTDESNFYIEEKFVDQSITNCR